MMAKQGAHEECGQSLVMELAQAKMATTWKCN